MSSNVSESTNAKMNYKIGGSVRNLKKRNSGSIYQTNPTQVMSTTGFDKTKFNSTVTFNHCFNAFSILRNFLGS